MIVLLIAAVVLLVISALFLWALCRAAALGDQMNERMRDRDE
jgi:CHASE3 domain sensor protein